MALEFDFIIIGGGTSGLVVANRLSEDPNVQVLVLEAGSNHMDDPRVKVPAFYEALKGSQADWGFESEPQTLLKGRQINYSQGCGLGGSSAINAHVFVPPSKAVIDSWELLGNTGWNWKTLKPYYTRAFTSPILTPELKSHLGIEWESNQATGPIQTSYSCGSQDPISKAWIETFKNINLNMDQDPFSGLSTGAFAALSSIDPATKERSYATTSYYVPAANRKNLHVYLSSEVQKILLKKADSGYRAFGVQYLLNDKPTTIFAGREVILAAGSLQSPKLLELSGIGNADLLQTHGIQVKIDNPSVGENLQDHFVCGIGFEAQDFVPTLDGLVRQDPKELETAMGEYFGSKKGPLTSVGVSSYAYLPLMNPFQDCNLDHNLLKTDVLGKTSTPLMQLYSDILRQKLESKYEASGAYLTVATQSVVPGDPDFEGSPQGPVAGKFITLGTMLSQPTSRGSVHVSSASPEAKPLIDPKFLSQPLDLEILARQVAYLPQIADMEPFKNLLIDGGRRRDPKSNFGSLDEAKDYVRTSSISMWHPTSTCSMLPKSLGGVVDERLLVYGTGNLRIVDASIMPLIPMANIQSSVYAVAERAADIIKAEDVSKST